MEVVGTGTPNPLCLAGDTSCERVREMRQFVQDLDTQENVENSPPATNRGSELELVPDGLLGEERPRDLRRRVWFRDLRRTFQQPSSLRNEAAGTTVTGLQSDLSATLARDHGTEAPPRTKP